MSDYDLGESVAVLPSFRSCPTERSEPEASSGEMWAVHASTEKEGYWRLVVWPE